MFNKLVNTHIQDIEKLVKNNTILVYKGFPVYFYKKIIQHYPSLNEKDIFKGNKLDLNAVRDSAKDLVTNFINKRGVYSLTYEELIVLMEKVNDLSLRKGEIVIIQNNLFNEYPNQSNVSFIDIEEKVEKNNLDFKENKLFNSFYANSVIRKGVNYVQYRDVELEDNQGRIIYKNFFDLSKCGDDLKYKEVDEVEIEKINNYIRFPNSDSYLNFKYRLFQDKKLSPKQILITDSVALKNKKNRTELIILQFLFRQNNLHLDIFVKTNTSQKKYRKEIIQILNKYWHSNRFRELSFYRNPDLNNEKEILSQGLIIEDIIQQSEFAQKDKNSFSDIFLTAPTGSGKSILFQIPAIYLSKKQKLLTIVISPLKALMYDQVETLKKRGVKFATYINSDISLSERNKIIEQIKDGDISIIYLSPELLLSYDIKNFIGDRRIGLFVIDEAHLVTTWGRDFRVDYWYLGNYIKTLRKYQEYAFPILALTATAVYGGEDDIVFETIESLNMQTPKLYIGNVKRDEIIFEINDFHCEKNHENSKMEQTKKVIINTINKNIKTIVYFPWTNQIKLIMDELPDDYKKKVGKYFGDVDKTEKQIVASKFYEGKIIDVLATKAFGMGVDIGDIRMIYHHAPSGNLSDYVQEIGRVARNKNIKGKAVVDFCNKDLKFTKILYGLSSIKQYQVKLALEKIWELYTYKKKTKFLVSAQDFAYIFSDKVRDIETKVKSTLLLLEKDLHKKYGYYVLLIRPKSLFSTVFACIPESIENAFIKKYGNYCQKVINANENIRIGIQKDKAKDLGNIYKIKLDKIWERFFPNESFPMVKRGFFEQTLFKEFNENVSPRYKLTINLKENSKITQNKLDSYFNLLDRALLRLSKRYFNSKDLEEAISNSFKDEVFIKRVSNLILNLYTTPSSFNRQNRGLAFDTFIQTKKNDYGEDIYRIVDSAYEKVKHYVIRKYVNMFPEYSTYFCKYITVNDENNEWRIKIAYLLESLALGSYEITGGQHPQIFIRVNDPYKIRLLSRYKDYLNEVLKNIDLRHQHSIQVMEKFFTSKMTNSERWTFIEDYFLGKLT